MSHKYVYLFTEGDGTMRNLLGGKGANLAEMAKMGLPVPLGFTVSTEACTRYYEDGKTIGDDIMVQIDAALAEIEKINGKKFGDPNDPLLVSVRSGARASMPGMMDTILNLGLNDISVEGFAQEDRQPALCVRLLSPIYSDVLRRRYGHAARPSLTRILEEIKQSKSAATSTTPS
jgi:pyruvate,orthophosphate dikinase